MERKILPLNGKCPRSTDFFHQTVVIFRLCVILFSMRQLIKGKRVLDVEKLVLSDGTEVQVEMKLLAYIPRKVDRNKYVKLYQDEVLKYVVKGKFSRTDLKVFLWFASVDPWGNDWIIVNYRKLAEELGVGEDSVRKACKKLVEADLLIQFEPRKTIFRLNPRIIYKGGVVGKSEDIDF